MILSDTHNFAWGQAERSSGGLQLPTPKVDVLLHCGDLTMEGGPSCYEQLLKMLGAIDAELKLVIAGNHDLDLDQTFWHSKLDPAGADYEAESAQHAAAVDVMTGPLAKEAGVTYLVEGLHTFSLTNGARFTIYASPYQPEFCGWAFPYERDEDRFNPREHVAPGVKSIVENAVPDFPGVEIMMTHGPPKDILDWTAQGNVGCEALMRAVSRARPLLYCFGHIHEAHGSRMVTWKDDKTQIGAGAVDCEDKVPNGYPDLVNPPVRFGKETLMVNAAIMNISYKPVNPPWIVDLELPKAGS